jgi:Protein of unknown function (DUF2442)
LREPIGGTGSICYIWSWFREPTLMIKIVRLAQVDGLRLRLTFSDGQSGVWDGAALLASKDTLLTLPLRDPAEFARAFIENGALAWPNGLELAPWTLHADMNKAGLLTRAAA